MSSERDWYGRNGWPKLRGSIQRIASFHFDIILGGIAGGRNDIETLVEEFLTAVVRDMNARIAADGSSRWSYGISLFDEVSTLSRMIATDPAIAGMSRRPDLSSKAALGAILKRYLERARLRQSPSSANRQAVWEKIDRISRRVMAEEERVGRTVDRCSDEHVEAVRLRCRGEYPSDTDLAVGADYFRAIFDEFCPDCVLEYDPERPEALSSFIGGLMVDTDMKPAIRICLPHLQRNDPALSDAFLVTLGLHGAIPLAVVDYANRLGVTRYEVDRRAKEAAKRLERCIRNSINMLLGDRR